MATISDDFTGGRDTGLWDELDSEGSGAVADANNQIECTNGSGTTAALGLVTKITYDLAAPSDVEADYTKIENEAWTYIGLTKVTTSNPHSENDWYRWGQSGGSYYAQKKVGGGSVTTIGSGGAAIATVNYKIDLPTTGDDVRFLEDASEKLSDATYALSSRDCYLYIFGWVTTSSDEIDFDNFSATYTAAGGPTTYYQTNTGSITPAGALSSTVMFALLFVGSITMLGGITKKTFKNLLGNITPSGAITKKTFKTMFGSITPSGSLVASFTVLQAIAGSILMTGAVATIFILASAVGFFRQIYSKIMKNIYHSPINNKDDH